VVVKVFLDQVGVERQGGEDGWHEYFPRYGVLQGRNPHPSTQPICSLSDHNLAWHMDDPEVTSQLGLQGSDLHHLLMEMSMARGPFLADPVRRRVIGEVKQGYALDLPRAVGSNLPQREEQGGELFPIRGESEDSW
jgi:hypothetical protein